MHGSEFIQDLAVVMILAGLAGWICHRLGLSTVVGYLAAGIVVGPHTTPFALVTDEGRIQTMAQVGLVFLMFSIGLRLNFRKLQRLGPSLLLATFAGAGLMYYFARLTGAALGWSGIQSLFLGGMLMVSSSAIISKVLQETGATHERAGQLAMGITVLEDVVAVVMLTLLNSFVQIGGGARGSLGGALGMLGAFVALAGIGGLLLVPWLLRKMSISAGEELQTLMTAGLLFGLAIMAERAGYSLALGAFLLGAIVAETPQRAQVERTFEGLRDLFSAVFFVAAGMLIDVRLLGETWPLILGVALLTIVGRTVAVASGLAVIGTPAKESLRVGLSVTPIGEFSFIIAQAGVMAAVVPAKFYPLAVGVSLLTTLAAPLLIRRAEPISAWLAERQPQWLEELADFYHRWLAQAGQRSKASRLWQLSRKRFIQIGVEALLVTGLLVFSGQIFAMVERQLGPDLLFPGGLRAVFWSGLVLVMLAPLVAIWRNLSALALLYAQVTTAGMEKEAVLRPAVETGLKGGAGLLLYLWISAMLPVEGAARWVLLAGAAAAATALAVLWRRLIYWHSHLEVGLNEVLAGANQRMPITSAPWLKPHEDWNLNVAECVLPDLADCQGRTIHELALRAQFGCTVVGIERQGFMIANPTVESVIYPRDKVLLLGTPSEVAVGKSFLTRVSGEVMSTSMFDEVRMESVIVPVLSRCAGRTLGELGVTTATGVQISGIHRQGLRILNPGADEKISAGDEVLVMGTPGQISVFKEWLREEAEPPPGRA